MTILSKANRIKKYYLKVNLRIVLKLIGTNIEMAPLRGLIILMKKSNKIKSRNWSN